MNIEYAKISNKCVDKNVVPLNIAHLFKYVYINVKFICLKNLRNYSTS